ncbi:MAG: calcium-binding protein, partial [Pseudomonadota bacterium]
DGSFDATLEVDDDTDGLIEHTATILNMEVIRTISDTENDTLDLSALDAVAYDNAPGDGDTTVTDGSGATGTGQLQGFENVIGTGGDDTLQGSKQDETLDGGGGDDTIGGGDGDDSLVGGSGDDTIDGGAGNDTLSGGEGCDVLLGGSGDDSLIGGAESDFFNGGAGNDTMDGGTGQDIFDVRTADEGSNVIEGGAGLDFAHYSGSGDDVSTDVITDAAGGFVLNVTDAVSLMEGDDMTLTFTGDGPNEDEDDDDQDDDNEGFTFDFLIGNKNVTETIIVGDVADATDPLEIAVAVGDALENRGYDVTENGDGTVTVSGSPDGEPVRLNNVTTLGTLDTDVDAGIGLSATSDQGEGQTVDLRGADMAGVTVLNLNGGSVVLSSGTFNFNALSVVGDGDVTFAALGDDGELVANGLTDANLTSTSVDLANDGNTAIEGGSGNDTLQGSSDDWDEVLSGGEGDDSIQGLEGDDALNGEDGNDTLEGGSGNDTLDGGSGDDLIDSGTGVDSVDGGEGDDVIILGDGEVTSVGTGLSFEARMDGADADLFTVSLTAGDRVTFDIDNGITVDDPDTVDDESLGSADLFLGVDLPGADVDDFLLDEANDDGGVLDKGSISIVDPFLAYTATETGTHTILVTGDGSGVPGTLTGDETYTLVVQQAGSTANGGDGNDSITAGNTNDELNGDDGSDTIDGGDGEDTLSGGSGVDFLDGEDGDDSLNGGSGDDVLVGGDGEDTLQGGNGADELTGGSGADTFFFEPGDTTDNSESRPTEPGADCITDLDRDEGDVIDFSAFGSGFVVTNMESSSFLVVEEAFDEPTADIHLVEVGDDTQVILDVDGDGLFSQDDVVIIVKDRTDLAGADFTGATTLFSGDEDDLLVGSPADEDFVGGIGNDTMTGGGGADNFRFEAADSTPVSDADADGISTDIITDYDGDNDRLFIEVPPGGTDIEERAGTDPLLVSGAGLTGDVTVAFDGTDSQVIIDYIDTGTFGPGDIEIILTGYDATTDEINFVFTA